MKDSAAGGHETRPYEAQSERDDEYDLDPVDQFEMVRVRPRRPPHLAAFAASGGSHTC